MSAPLRELLDDLVVHVPAAVAPPEVAERAYADSRRRRRARRLRALSVAASVTLLMALLVPALVPELATLTSGRTSDRDSVRGFPRRIEGPLPDRELPARPGAMAGVLSAHGAWYVVNEDGKLWRLPLVVSGPDRPSLSRDGRLLGYPEDDGARYVIRDLVSGRRVEFVPKPRRSFDLAEGYTYAEMPGWWSPNGGHLVVGGGPSGRHLGPALLLDPTSGAATALPREAMPVGWSSNEQIVWLRWDSTKAKEGAGPMPPYAVIVTDLAGRPVSSVTLTGTGGYLNDTQQPEQWSAAISADGKSLALVDHNPSHNAVRRFDLATGVEAGPATPLDDEFSRPCAVSWGKVPALVSHGYDGVVITESLAAADPDRVSVASPRLDMSCMVWASDALDGHPRGGGLLRRATSPWTWWWREWVAGIATAIAVVGVLRWLYRRLRRRRPVRPGPAGVDWYAG